jgi:hypothetical protein
VADPPIAFLVIGVELVESSCTRRMRLSAHDEGEAPSRTAGEASASRLGLVSHGSECSVPSRIEEYTRQQTRRVRRTSPPW